MEHTSLAFLGITSNVPAATITSTTRSRRKNTIDCGSFFEPYEVRIDRVPGEVDTDKDGLSRIYDAEIERPTYLLVRGDIQMPDKDHVLTPNVPRLFGEPLGKIEPVSLPIRVVLSGPSPVRGNRLDCEGESRHRTG